MRFAHDGPIFGVLVMSGELDGVSRSGVEADEESAKRPKNGCDPGQGAAYPIIASLSR